VHVLKHKIHVDGIITPGEQIGSKPLLRSPSTDTPRAHWTAQYKIVHYACGQLKQEPPTIMTLLILGSGQIQEFRN